MAKKYRRWHDVKLRNPHTTPERVERIEREARREMKAEEKAVYLRDIREIVAAGAITPEDAKVLLEEIDRLVKERDADERDER